MTPEKLKTRELVHIDIANDPVASSDYKESEDPIKYEESFCGHLRSTKY